MHFKYSPVEILLGIAKTLALLLILEVLTSAVFPALGIMNFKPAFNVLIVLFLAFKLDHPLLPFLILIVQVTHSVFSIEGWASGTFTGILIALTLRYVKEMLNFSNPLSTILVVQVFQLAWFLMAAILLAIKMGDFASFFPIFFKYVPESIFLSIVSPFFFKILDHFWYVDRQSHGVTI